MLIKVRFAFFLSFLSMLTIPLFFPWAKLYFFAPTLIIAIYRRRLLVAFWYAVFCGIVCDLFSSSTFFGTTSLSYCLMIALLSRFKRHFFEDTPTTIPLLSYLFGIFYPITQIFISLFFSGPSLFSWKWILTDLFLMSICDAFYAFVVFVLPPLLFKIVKRSRRQSIE